MLKRYQDVEVAAEPPRHFVYADERADLRIMQRIAIDQQPLGFDGCLYDPPNESGASNALVQEWLRNGAAIGGECIPEHHYHTVKVQVSRGNFEDDREIDAGVAASIISDFLAWAERAVALCVYVSDQDANRRDASIARPPEVPKPAVTTSTKKRSRRRVPV